MKFRILLSGLIATTSLNANAALIDYTSSFTDNGNKVTEVRTFNDNSVQTWEWLDLTVTNGISYNSLVADLNNDGLLNNSDSVLNANDGAKLDVAALAVADQSGWNTVSDDGVVDLFNAYFGTSLLDDQTHDYGMSTTIVEEFIDMFGDTHHEGEVDFEGSESAILNAKIYSGYTYGMTNTAMWFEGYNEVANVSDGECINSACEDYDDTLYTQGWAAVTSPTFAYGTWIRREVVAEVPEPTSMALFALALSGLVARRRRLI